MCLFYVCKFNAFSLREAKPPKFSGQPARHRPTCTPGLGGQAQVLRSFWRDGSLKFLTLEVLNAHPELYCIPLLPNHEPFDVQTLVPRGLLPLGPRGMPHGSRQAFSLLHPACLSPRASACRKTKKRRIGLTSRQLVSSIRRFFGCRSATISSEEIVLAFPKDATGTAGASAFCLMRPCRIVGSIALS